MDHKELKAWKLAVDTAEQVYKLTDSYPKSELYGLTSQMRRAAVSIASNIAEGAGRFSDKEMIQFLYIAIGSSAELETQICISERLMYLKNNQVDQITDLLTVLKKTIFGLIKYLKSKSK